MKKLLEMLIVVASLMMSIFPVVAYFLGVSTDMIDQVFIATVMISVILIPILMMFLSDDDHLFI